jgi:signal transduction histidine kinase
MRSHGGRTDSIRAFCRKATAVSALLTSVALPGAAHADTAGLFNDNLNGGQIVLLATLAGAITFAVLSSIALMRARNRAETENAELRGQIAGFKASAERAEALVEGAEQRLVAWGPPGEAPLVAGQLTASVGVPGDRAAFLAFGTWLQPESAARLDRAIERLRESGDAFAITIATVAGSLVEASGRTVGSSAVASFRDLSGDRLARAEAEARYDLLVAEVETLKATLSAAPMPIWLRDDEGRLTWVNAAYAHAVEAPDPETAVERGLELLDSAVRGTVEAAHRDDPVFMKRLPAIVAGSRRIFDVVDIASENGSAGIASDVTAIEAAEAALRREIDFNARTLDQLTTAVAIFGADRRLKSCNAAYRALFGLDEAFIASRPEENMVLDRLRASRKLPEQADFRTWRDGLLSAYRSLETREHWWHMPDGQTLRVIANPNPQGGMTWVYENVTERLDLESRYNALIHVQGETIDHLAEGVAVFGSDGRLRLHNPAFARIWGLPADLLTKNPHVSDVVAAGRRPGDDAAAWTRFTASVAGLDETRSNAAGRMDRPDGRVIDYATVPLPDGQTMVTFVDVTDSERVARALVDRNEALEAADAMKNAFIHHVSYELRSPLTNIIGFTQLLADARVGPLNERQHEYVGYVMSSSTALLAIVNDILDLATIDAGIMELDLSEVDIVETVNAAIEGLKDRLAEARIELRRDIPRGIGSFIGDGKRIRQILFNLLANAVEFSRNGGRVLIAARRDGGVVEFTVSDDGPGIPRDFLDSVFDPFASRPRGEGRGGAGLGLSIVRSFVALHGGTVEIESDEGRGVTVRVRLPARPGITAAAAE